MAIVESSTECSTKAGFIAVVGRPNAGKSTLLNALVSENITMVSHKINATRKRMNIIVMHNEAQIIFIDTPGIHTREKLLNQFMLQEALKAIDDCDFVLFLAPISDEIKHYEDFLELCKKPHILLLTKIDRAKNAQVLEKIAEYERFLGADSKCKAIIPISASKSLNIGHLLDEIVKFVPHSPYFYDTDIISTQNLREIYKEKIREAIFLNAHDEIPYESDVEIKSFKQSKNLDRIYAEIIVEKESQKIILIGKNAATIKNIGISARKKIQEHSGVKLFLELKVVVKKGWSKNKKILQEIGYNFAE